MKHFITNKQFNYKALDQNEMWYLLIACIAGVCVCDVCYGTTCPMATLLHVPLSLGFSPPGQLDVNVTDMSSGSPSWVTIILEESFCEKNK